jgi:hypothetical protein
MRRVEEEISKVSAESLLLEDEASKSEQILPRLIPSLRIIRQKRASNALLLDSNIGSLQQMVSAINDVITPYL